MLFSVKQVTRKKGGRRSQSERQSVKGTKTTTPKTAKERETTVDGKTVSEEQDGDDLKDNEGVEQKTAKGK